MGRRTTCRKAVAAMTLLLAAVTSMAVVAAPLLPAAPVSAHIGSVSAVLSSNVVNTLSNYTITFRVVEEVPRDTGYITVSFPYGTAMPATGDWALGDVTLRSTAGSGAVNAETNMAVADLMTTAPATATQTGPTVTIALTSLADDVSRASTVTVGFLNDRIINPSTIGHYTLSVSTSAETAPEESAAYVLTAPQAVPPDPADLPDLVVTEKHEAWELYHRLYIVHYTVKNIGATTALAGHDAELWIDGSRVDQREVSVPLAPGENYSGTFLATFTDHSSIEPEIWVCTDANGEVEESAEDNNCLANTWPEFRPDLEVVSAPSHWVDGEEGATYTVGFVVKNMGIIAAPGGHDLSLAVDGIAIEEEVEVPHDLARGESFSSTFTTEIQLSGTSDEVRVCVDVNGEIPELDEDDNCLTSLREAEVRVDVDLVDGWNIISLSVRPSVSYTACTLAADINSQGGRVTEVFRWNAIGGNWDIYLVDSQYGTDFAIDVGYGYLLNSGSATTWSYAGAPLTARFGAVFQPRITQHHRTCVRGVLGQSVR